MGKTRPNYNTIQYQYQQNQIKVGQAGRTARTYLCYDECVQSGRIGSVARVLLAQGDYFSFCHSLYINPVQRAGAV